MYTRNVVCPKDLDLALLGQFHESVSQSPNFCDITDVKFLEAPNIYLKLSVYSDLLKCGCGCCKSQGMK